MDRRSVLRNIGLLLAAGAAVPYIPIEKLMKLKLLESKPFLLYNMIDRDPCPILMDNIYLEIAKELSLAIQLSIDKAMLKGDINTMMPIGTILKTGIKPKKLIAVVKFR